MASGTTTQFHVILPATIKYKNSHEIGKTQISIAMSIFFRSNS